MICLYVAINVIVVVSTPKNHHLFKKTAMKTTFQVNETERDFFLAYTLLKVVEI